MQMKKSKTPRGFYLIEFEDHYGVKCSLQESSLASEHAIWLGCSGGNPQILASAAARFGVTPKEAVGWVPFQIPEEVSITTRMHLTREGVAALLPYLIRFVDTGDICKESDAVAAEREECAKVADEMSHRHETGGTGKTCGCAWCECARRLAGSIRARSLAPGGSDAVAGLGKPGKGNPTTLAEAISKGEADYKRVTGGGE